ncbi:MAG: hypothetical protein RLZZ422_1755 [Pseudomonadota bacterium]|jgi:ABC-type uncharacterized transport system involved in gliding motility auxiliary subunit
MKMTRKLHRQLWLNNGVFYLLFSLILGGLAFLSAQFSNQFDWTYGNRNSLSPSTQSLLRSIQEPLELVAYLPQNSEVKDSLEKLIKKYQLIKADTRLTILNPDLSPQQAVQDEVQYTGQLVLKLGTGNNQRKELLDSLNEANFVSALMRMTRHTERIALFIEGHGEKQPLWTESNGLSRLTEVLEKSGFKIQPHHLLKTQSIPTNTSLVVLAAPQSNLLESEVKLLSDYIKQGGNLLWLQDPGDLKGLGELANSLNIKIHQGTVVDANESLQAMLGIKHPAVVPVIEYDPRSKLTRNLKIQTIFPFATMVTRNQAPDGEKSEVWLTEEFLQTLPQSWLEVEPLQDKVVYDDTKGDLMGPITIGLSLARTLEENSSTKTSMIQNKQQRVVIIGDSDFLTNQFIGYGGNLDLATQIFNWLSADDALVGIKSNPAPDLVFEMNKALSMGLALFFLLGLPALLFITGLWIWARRQRL